MIDKDVYGPWAVVAGGSEGVGAAFAHQLADAGLNLVLVARKPGPLAETAEQVRAKGVEVRTLELDLTDPGALKAVRAATDDVEVGLLIFNAGANSYGHEFVTGDLDRGQRFAEQLRSGMVHVNDATCLDEAHAPFGGLGASGLGGRAGGEANLDEFTETRWISVQRGQVEYPY